MKNNNRKIFKSSGYVFLFSVDRQKIQGFTCLMPKSSDTLFFYWGTLTDTITQIVKALGAYFTVTNGLPLFQHAVNE